MSTGVWNSGPFGERYKKIFPYLFPYLRRFSKRMKNLDDRLEKDLHELMTLPFSLPVPPSRFSSWEH
jgi:hypothetical protein